MMETKKNGETDQNPRSSMPSEEGTSTWTIILLAISGDCHINFHIKQ